MGTINRVRTTDSSRTPVESTDTRGAPLSAMYHPPKGCAMPLALIDADFRKGGESIVWGYGRGSDEDQRNTPIVQRQYVEARIEALNGKAGKYGGFFCDEDTSGRKIAWIRRPAARILTELLQAGDSIVVHRLDRIGRSLQDVPRLLAWLNLNKIDLYVCDQGGQAIDYAGANSKFMVHVTAAAAQLYSDLNSERIRETFASLKARNLPWYGRPRFGWGRQPVNHRDANGRTRLRWEYYPCERERAEIRLMVDKYGREGWTLVRIWDDLRRRNCLRADGVKKWAYRLPCGQRALGGQPQRQQPDKASGQVGPRTQEMPPTELFGSSPSSAQAVPAQLREYQILERLGAGGMGTVYKALHTKLVKLVALKVLPAAAMQDAELVARFEREMEAVGKLEHPNIVRAMDAGCHEGTHFLVMEYVDGMDLAEVVKRCGPLRIADACEVIRQAALGLRYADEHALVHRDIKPSNLVLSTEGEVKILDLGLALLQADRMAGGERKAIKPQAGGGDATATSRAMGTLDYMAPEQVRDSHNVDIRADIYSLGCTLYKLLAGHAPFGDPRHENTFDKMMAHLNEPVPPIRQLRSNVPEQLAAVLERMVAKNRDARYAKPGQVVEDLKPFCPGCDLAGLLAHAQKATHADATAPAPAGKAQAEKLPSPVSGEGPGVRGPGAQNAKSFLDGCYADTCGSYC